MARLGSILPESLNPTELATVEDLTVSSMWEIAAGASAGTGTDVKGFATVGARLCYPLGSSEYRSDPTIGENFHMAARLLAVALFLITGCSHDWHVWVTRIDAEYRPTFCVSERPQCSGEGVRVDGFKVVQLGGVTGHHIVRLLWWIEPAEDWATLGTVVYGVTPPGYKLMSGPEPLRPGRSYQVGAYVFGFYEKEGKVFYRSVPVQDIPGFIVLD